MFSSVHVGMQDADNFYSFGVFPIIDDIALKLADGKEAHVFELFTSGPITRTHAWCGENGFEGAFSGLINAGGGFRIIPGDIEPDVDEITLSRWCYED